MYLSDIQVVTATHTHLCKKTPIYVHETDGDNAPMRERIHKSAPPCKERNSNLELYRIIVMLLIVAHHYVVNSGLMSVMKEEPLHIQSIFLYLLGMWGKIGINCFVMITGYFMCKSNLSLRKFMKLLFEVYFYKIIITSIFLFTGYDKPTFNVLFFTLVPIEGFSKSFVACFMVFYLLIPFLNILINNMNGKQHLQLVGLCLLVYSLIGSFSRFLSFNYISWFTILYFIASYIRLYGFPREISHKQWGQLTAISLLISMASVVGMAWLSSIFVDRKIPVYWFVADSNHIMAVITALCSFMFFKDLKIKHSKLINTIGASTFGVLLIHANSDTMRQWLWWDTLNNVEQYGKDTIYIHAVVSVIAIFMICTLIDIVRIRFIERPLLESKVMKLIKTIKIYT